MVSLGRVALGLIVGMTAPATTARAEGRSAAWHVPSLTLPTTIEIGTSKKARNLFVPIVALGSSSCETQAIDEGLRVIANLAELLGGGVVVSSMLLAEPCGGAVSTKPIVLPAQIGRSGYGISVVGRF